MTARDINTEYYMYMYLSIRIVCFSQDLVDNKWRMYCFMFTVLDELPL